LILRSRVSGQTFILVNMCLCHVPTGLNHPMIPILVVFQLLWSAAGVKLWRRHQALLNAQWHNSSSTTRLAKGSASQGLGVSGGTIMPSRSTAKTMASASPDAGNTCRVADLSDSRQGSLAYSHFRGGAPQWAVEAPTATGTRWQFAGMCISVYICTAAAQGYGVFSCAVSCTVATQSLQTPVSIPAALVATSRSQNILRAVCSPTQHTCLPRPFTAACATITTYIANNCRQCLQVPGGATPRDSGSSRHPWCHSS
jgi:hypothetical protein